MSAECSKHGTDIVYPEGTWPVGVCPSCERDALLAVMRAERAESRVEMLEAVLREIVSLDETADFGTPPFGEIARTALRGGKDG
jgi:hypothetical protein